MKNLRELNFSVEIFVEHNFSVEIFMEHNFSSKKFLWKVMFCTENLVERKNFQKTCVECREIDRELSFSIEDPVEPNVFIKKL